MLRIPLLFSCLLLLFIAGCKDCESVTENDKIFLGLAGSAGIMEVEMGKLAIKKATKPKLKEFGEMMVKEHSSFNEDYIKVCRRICVEPTTTMNQNNRDSVRHMAQLEGNAFNENYTRFMVVDHGHAVKHFERFYSVAENRTYKAFLERGIKIVKHHFRLAQELAK